MCFLGGVCRLHSCQRLLGLLLSLLLQRIGLGGEKGFGMCAFETLDASFLHEVVDVFSVVFSCGLTTLAHEQPVIDKHRFEAFVDGHRHDVFF